MGSVPGTVTFSCQSATSTFDATLLLYTVFIYLNSVYIVLLWPPYGIGQAIIFLSCGFFFYLLLFFIAYSQPSQIGCLPYFHTWCGLSANLGCRSETCCTRPAENTGCKKIDKNSPSAHHCKKFAGLYLRN